MLASAKGDLELDAALPPFPEPLFETKEQLAPLPSDPETRLLPHKEWMTERLAAGWHTVTLFEELPMKVTLSSFYRFLDRHGLGEPGPAERVVPEIIHKPGEALLLDWGPRNISSADGAPGDARQTGVKC